MQIWRVSNENTQYTYVLKKRKYIPIMPPALALRLTLIGSNYLCLEHIFYGSKSVWAIEVLL